MTVRPVIRPAVPLTPRRFVALAAGKAAALASRATGRGGGQSLPGMVARRIDPTILDALVARRGLPVVAITGSNGKTTTARFAAAILRAAGLAVHHNAAGANLVQGVTSVAVAAADLRGQIPDGVLLAEVDEGALPIVAPELRPRVVLVTDLFRDQLDRYGELYAVADAIDSVASALPADDVLVINADDPLVARLAPARVGRKLTFGLDLDRSTDRIGRAADTIRCPVCRADLAYDHVYLSHLGAWRCLNCGAARPNLDVAVTALELRGIEETRFRVRTPAGELDLCVPQSGVHIAYDAAAAIAIALGLGLDLQGIPAALASVGPAFGRLEQIAAGERRIVLAFAKNPTSFNTTLRTLATENEPRQLLVAVSNTLVDGEDFAWLWDVDFESAASRIERVTASGSRGDELVNRLKYAGVEPARMRLIEDRGAALDSALAGIPPGGRLTILAGYTPTIELREQIRRRGWTGRYWEA
ncbi:MAG TPA: MurT ligase domain-containing protein [Candidatus Limnocylindrales bacterium]|nr:MurT ligase domain-containing protein [Candidatus Limnocylindrales bacterium]